MRFKCKQFFIHSIAASSVVTFLFGLRICVPVNIFQSYLAEIHPYPSFYAFVLFCFVLIVV